MLEEREKANLRAQQWKAGEERYLQRSRERNQADWIAWHTAQAETVLETAGRLAEEHRAKARVLAHGEPN
jgi:hypothetical protein